MSLSTAANGNCSYIEEQLNHDALNPFAVFGLRADDVLLTHNGARLRFKILVKHVFESGDLGAKTSGPRIPLWKHLNVAKNMLFEDGVSSRAFERLKKKWGLPADRDLLNKEESGMATISFQEKADGSGIMLRGPMT